tara:strand:- start:265 stop:405 length:141 start_codon:yes stop_codon:yes gene_type:complete
MPQSSKTSWNVLAKHQAELKDGSVYQSKIKAKSKQNQAHLKFIIKF